MCLKKETFAKQVINQNPALASDKAFLERIEGKWVAEAHSEDLPNEISLALKKCRFVHRTKPVTKLLVKKGLKRNRLFIKLKHDHQTEDRFLYELLNTKTSEKR